MDSFSTSAPYTSLTPLTPTHPTPPAHLAPTPSKLPCSLPRRSANAAVVRELQSKVDKGENVDFEFQDVHIAAVLLKTITPPSHLPGI